MAILCCAAALHNLSFVLHETHFRGLFRAGREAFCRILNRQSGEPSSPEDAWDGSAPDKLRESFGTEEAKTDNKPTNPEANRKR